MKAAALKRAKADFDAAKRAVDALKLEKRPSVSATHWSNFLSSFSRTINRFSAGAEDGLEKEWSGRIRHALRSDDLLKYVKNARDADEHGTLLVSDEIDDSININFKSGTDGYIDFLHLGPHGIIMGPKASEKLFVMKVPAHLELVTVTNYGVKYDPPTQYCGKYIDGKDPVAVASAALDYLSARLREAEEMQASSQ